MEVADLKQLRGHGSSADQLDTRSAGGSTPTLRPRPAARRWSNCWPSWRPPTSIDPVARLARDRRGAAMPLRRWRRRATGPRTSRRGRTGSAADPEPLPRHTHTSSADADGYVCSITESNGYGAGLIVHGMLLNNTLGEEELNPLGVHRSAAGCTLSLEHGADDRPEASGATRRCARLARCRLGSSEPYRTDVHPDRGGRRLARRSRRRAAGSSRSSAETGLTLCYEPGLPGDQTEGFLLRPYDEIHMYFGAVQAAAVTEYGDVDAAHDPRRSGGSLLI